MKYLLLIVMAMFSIVQVDAQVKIGDNEESINAGSLLELESINKGLLFSRVSLDNDLTVWKLNGNDPADGMVVFNINDELNAEGLYCWYNEQWNLLAKGGGTPLTMGSVLVGVAGSLPDSAVSVGDIYSVPDTTFAWDGEKWQIIALNENNSVFVGDKDALALNKKLLIGDIVNDQDSISIWNGSEWKLISVLPSAKVDSFQVYINTTGTVNSWLGKVADQDDFRVLMRVGSDNPTLKGTDGVVIYYPAKWGDFTYSIGYPIDLPSTKVELANGISTETVDANVGPQAKGFYKKVTIASKEATIYVD